jgi:predicted transcriptional regulator
VHRESIRNLDGFVLKKIFIYYRYMYKSGGIIIKQSTVKVLDDKDMEFVNALRNLRVSKNVATLITFLASADEATSREIELGTRMRQPEVSIGMRGLRQNNWIEEHEVKAEGKGRPTKVYKLNVPIEKIIQHYEEQKSQEAAQTMQAIQRPKEIAAT